MSDTRIMIVEDDEPLGRQMLSQLRSAGYDATWVASGEQALATWEPSYRLLVLDLMLPGLSGLDVLEHLQALAGGHLATVIVSAREDPADERRARALTTADYLRKPFWPEELLARVAAQALRAARQPERPAPGDAGAALLVDPASRRASVDGRVLELTDVEFDLLAALFKRAGAAISRAWLEQNVAGLRGGAATQTRDVHVERLRGKLGAAGRRIAAVWGVGYRLEAAARDEE